MDVGFCRGPARGRVLPDVAAQLGCSMRPPRVVVRSVVASTRRRCYSAKITPELAVPNGHFAQATIAEAVGRLVIRTGRGSIEDSTSSQSAGRSNNGEEVRSDHAPFAPRNRFAARPARASLSPRATRSSEENHAAAMADGISR